jgi:hypothetical protein
MGTGHSKARARPVCGRNEARVGGARAGIPRCGGAREPAHGRGGGGRSRPACAGLAEVAG